MNDDFLNKPILFLIFNRPECTARVFEAIRRAKPKQLFVAADGPRPNISADAEKCEQARAVINKVDWDCEVKTLWREDNLGCKAAISSALDWFFSQVEAGIILEDDCLPNTSFFGFCEKMLELYKDDERVMMAGGTNYLFNKVEMEQSYFFTRNFAIWGWATWRRAWKKYDITMKNWPALKRADFLSHVYKNKNVANYMGRHYDLAYNNLINTWDIQWHFSCLSESGLCIAPKYNLVSNIGADGTHTPKAGRKNLALFLETKELNGGYLVPPVVVCPDYELENMQFKNSGLARFPFKYYLTSSIKKILITLKLWEKSQKP